MWTPSRRSVSSTPPRSLASLLGACVAREFLGWDRPTAELSSILGHQSYIALPSVLTRNFVFKVCGTDAPRSRPLLTKEEVEANKKEYHSQP
ncbi:hypothetical protein WJX79_002003 [Trebouxia sp. C0005]